MDLAQFETRKHADDGVDFPFIDIRTGEKVVGDDGNPITFRLGCLDGPRIRAAVYARRKERGDAKKSAAEEAAPSADDELQREREAAEDLATQTLGCSNNFKFRGQPFEFSQAAVADLYFSIPVLLVQMSENARGRANFFLEPAKT